MYIKALCNEQNNKFKQNFTPLSAKNNPKNYESNKNLNSKGKDIEEVGYSNNFSYNKEQQNSKNLEQKNEQISKKGAFSFNSFFENKKKNTKSFSIENALKGKKFQKNNNMDKKETNNLILLKYSKDYKFINNKEQIKVKKMKLII